jgi:regulator of protease activity HflC (stomatin/prohibitin superfamily)
MDTEDKMLTRSIIKWSTIGSVILLFVISGGMIGCPAYRVYEQRKAGEAKLREAESSRQIVIQEAKAKLEAATLLSQADTIRAHGVARSNAIIGESLKGRPEYLHWLWIDNIEKNPQAVIYVPTEANLPILEANRFNNQTTKLQ